MLHNTPPRTAPIRRATRGALLATLTLPFLGNVTVAAQFASDNVALVGQLAPATPGIQYSDVWGFVDETSGDEYAILCSRLGVHLIDCSDPAGPVERSMIPTEEPGDLNQWVDAKVFGRYGYVVSQAYPGMQIIDLIDPTNAFKIEQWGVALWSGAHNLVIDEERGHLWVMGTDTGTHIIDIGTNPRAPTLIYVLAQPYSFDVHILGNHAYFADLFGNALLIYDVSNLPQSLPLVGYASFPGTKLAHSAWPTRDGKFVATANEAVAGPVGIFDLSSMASPQLVSTYKANANESPEATPHHIYVRDRMVHTAYWTEGYHLLDISDPSVPVEVGYIDTLPGAQRTGFRGAWGAYTGLPSGNILIGDTTSGLFVVKPRATPVRYGTPTADSTNAGTTPSIHTFGAAYLGNSRYAIEAADTPASTPCLFVLSSARASTPLLGATVNVSLAAPKTTVSMFTSIDGTAALPLPLPNMPAFDGIKLQAQFLFLGGTGFRSATEGVEIELFTL